MIERKGRAKRKTKWNHGVDPVKNKGEVFRGKRERDPRSVREENGAVSVNKYKERDVREKDERERFKVSQAGTIFISMAQHPLSTMPFAMPKN